MESVEILTERAKAVGHIPSGLFIVAAKDCATSKIDGYLASFIQQISFKPLLISLAVSPGRPVYDVIKKGHVFTINVVGDHDRTYLKHFWKGYDAAINPFDELRYQLAETTGVEMLQAKSSIHARMVESFRPGDHEIIIAEVLRSTIHHEESKPVTHLRKNGMSY